jgi:hypothetical protein
VQCGYWRAQVERMEQRRLFKSEQIRFAERALTLRYAEPGQTGMAASQLLSCQRRKGARDESSTEFLKARLRGRCTIRMGHPSVDA